MNRLPSAPPCLGCGLTRRQFFKTGCAACVGALAGSAALPRLHGANPTAKTRIRIVYALHAAQQPGPDWPNVGFDFRPVIGDIYAGLVEKCPGFEFTCSLAKGPEEAKQIVDQDKSTHLDGYLVVQMNPWNQVVQTIASSGKPVLYADFPFAGSGGFLIYNAAFLRTQATNVGFASSSRVSDLANAVRCFEVISRGGSLREFVTATAQARLQNTPHPNRVSCHKDPVRFLDSRECAQRMKSSKILAVRGQESGPAGDLMGIPVVHVPFSEVNDAWKAADRDQARSIAQLWSNNAARVEGVSPETLEASAAMYLAQKAVLQRHQADAITINCLGGFYGGHIHAYPCLGFHQLLNEGLVGACECDVRSTATMVAMTHLTQGRPGYISDPVIDTSKRQIIYAHCVASNRPFGPTGPANPYQILTHSEDRQGASVRSILPLDYLTTTLQIAQERKEILLHRARATANVPEDRACRTKLAAEPLGDFEKLFTLWDRWGWHRVTYYGDLRQPVYTLADTLGWTVVEET